MTLNTLKIHKYNNNNNHKKKKKKNVDIYVCSIYHDMYDLQFPCVARFFLRIWLHLSCTWETLHSLGPDPWRDTFLECSNKSGGSITKEKRSCIVWAIIDSQGLLKSYQMRNKSRAYSQATGLYRSTLGKCARLVFTNTRS